MNDGMNRLRVVRETQRRSLRSVARDAGISLGHLSRIERGEQQPSARTLVRLGRVLGLDDLVATIELYRSDD